VTRADPHAAALSHLKGFRVRKTVRQRDEYEQISPPHRHLLLRADATGMRFRLVDPWRHELDRFWYTQAAA